MMIPQKGGMCMKGGIYSEQKCPDCGRTYKDNGRSGLTCPQHSDRNANRFRVRFGKLGINKRFDNYREAQRFLTGLRFKYDEGSFDIRDYLKENPLGFQTLAQQWLALKENELKPKSFRNLFNTMKRAFTAWGNRNIKEISYAEIEDFLNSQRLERSGKPVSDKTKLNMREILHSFWQWLRRRRVLKPYQVPEFPEVSCELGFRNIVDKGTQGAILDEVHRLTFHFDPKIWLGVNWLRTYIALRPGDLHNVMEKHIDLEAGTLFVPHPKEKRPKLIRLLPEDVELLGSLPRGFPEQHFFRHPSRINRAGEGSAYGENYFRKWWDRACRNLGVEKVGLYGGTRHSTACALGQYHSPEEIKQATMHTTNKAFERYFRMGPDSLMDIYRTARGSDEKAGRTMRFRK
jgi:integrase